jgi:hypothetical protein
MISSSGGGGRGNVCRSQSLSLLMTIPVAHMIRPLLTRYQLHVARKAAEGEVPINVIL